MAVTAALKFTQTPNTNTPGKSFIADVGSPVTIANDDDTGVNTWTYVLLDAPRGSAIVPGTLVTGSTPSVDLTPDVSGTYRIQETISGPGGSGSQIRSIVVPNSRGWILPGYLSVAQELDFPDPVSANARGWASMLDVMFLDIASTLDTILEGASIIVANMSGFTSVLSARFVHTPVVHQTQDESQVNILTPSDAATTLLSYATADDRTYVVIGYISFQSADLAENGYYTVKTYLKNTAGTLTLDISPPVTTEFNETGTPVLDVVPVGTTFYLRGTGVTGVPIRWTGRVLIHELIQVPT